MQEKNKKPYNFKPTSIPFYEDATQIKKDELTVEFNEKIEQMLKLGLLANKPRTFKRHLYHCMCQSTCEKCVQTDPYLLCKRFPRILHTIGTAKKVRGRIEVHRYCKTAKKMMR